ncbi:transcriptional activator HlyU [Litchfieldella qijiaojingensis]|uniref:Transcriptional activator HlyU n=1 Tax=Litchfieldella qijiaojingensis TaxID=980347 RepID=A0ABQ2Z9P6_9GAMM|nr:HlyU family transcriptional regulator [Halomonas qijiaojingensis]GGY07034.1 transcriptional activator HlyU [Halomonas qijiaojingensis]
MLKKLFSGLFGGGDDRSASREADPVDYKGYLIISDPQDVGGQYRVSGWIRKPVEGGEMLEHRFERSDVVSGREACDELMVSKAQRFIDDLGDDIFKK